MMSYRLFQLIAVCVAVPALALAANTNASFRIQSDEGEGWVIDYVAQPIPRTTVEIDGIPYTLFQTGSSRDIGRPFLPSEELILGIPFGSSIDVQITNPVYAISENENIAPSPHYRLTDEKEAVAVYEKNEAAYAQNQFFPTEQIEVQSASTLRTQRIASVRLNPYRYNPVTRTLRQLVKATLRVRLKNSGNSVLDLRPAPPDPLFEPAYKSLLLNYEQAKRWRARDSHSGAAPLDSTRDWWETGRTYYRIPVAADGWYAIRRSDLISAGIDPDMIDLPTLRIYGRGSQIPLLIRPDTTIEFYAVRNYGDSTYFDFYTDTSAYFLTWGGATLGRRFAQTSQPPGPPTANVTSASTLRHFEQNTDYYEGSDSPGNPELIQIETVPGEGWTWGQQPEYLYPNVPRSYPFSLDAMDAAYPTARIHVRLFGVTNAEALINHHVQFSINDSLVGDIFFNKRTAGLLDTVFQRSLLNGTSSNTLKILSLPTQPVPNLCYLDWFELNYERNLQSESNRLVFTTPAAPGATVQFTVTGFSNPSIDVLDLTGNRMITGGTTMVDSASQYRVSFFDTLSMPKQYMIVATGGARSVLPLTQKTFNDIRTNVQGADYIIITHNNFLASAQQLAAHRQSFNGVRTAVIDVQDIYDEFNYGVLNATTLKTFLKYAYDHWQSPAPSFLLLLGDASWDYHHYLSTTIKTNFVPAYGVPASDNWFTSFDTTNTDSTHTFLPYMLVGRLPVENAIQAQHAVSKVIGYDSYGLGDWNKNFLMITGGTSPGEQTSFNFLTNSIIGTDIDPAPIGGTSFRVFKSTSAIVDGEHKQEMRDLVRDGLLFVNFIGHSGGRLWNVDIGSPNELENTDGKLPFVSSVSCNVGGFAEPSNNVLSEDFVLADNRGAIAMWASSSLGYAGLGSELVHSYLGSVVDSVRDFGSLTTIGRYTLWFHHQGDNIATAMVNLNPLLGDPLSSLALPLKPDLGISSTDISTNTAAPTPNDSSLIVHISLHNYGLVPTDSVRFTIGDVYDGGTASVLNTQLPPIYHFDSLDVQWNATTQVGLHTLTGTMDPLNMIDEVNELNNIASIEQYIYANLLAIVKPINNMVVSPGVQQLLVSSPIGVDSSGFQYHFELDTVDTFDSPFLVTSAPVTPGPVTGEWLTPPLPSDQVYFWRARTTDGSLTGSWVASVFTTSSSPPTLPTVRWLEKTKKQFVRENLAQTAATDSGVTIAPNVPINLFVRSLGYRANPDRDYYSIIKVNQQTIFGLWFAGAGNSFMVVRLNEFSGQFEVRPFDVLTQPTLADSMKKFIQDTPIGNYLAISVIRDGRTNVNESLYVAIESLGSTQIRQVQPGQSWAFIGRKVSGGPGMPALESLTNDSAIVSLQIPNYYSAGSGSITSSGFVIPSSWVSFHWLNAGVPGTTTARIALLGMRENGLTDTLRLLPQDSTDVDLTFLNDVTSGPGYVRFKPAALLSSSDALLTPVLKEWSVDFVPPADLAISRQTLGGPAPAIMRGATLNLPVTVYNTGFQTSDTSTVVVSVFDRVNRARRIASMGMDSIRAGDSHSIAIPIATTDFSRHVTLQVQVQPSKRSKDLVPENNIAYYPFEVSGTSATADIQVFADGVQIMDGDYVSSQPKILVRMQRTVPTTASSLEMLIDNRPIQSVVHSVADRPGQESGVVDQEQVFSLELTNGLHELRFEVNSVNEFGEMDTVNRAISVNVKDRLSILQLYNYPNPFRSDTYFTFQLTGSKPADELSIRIFTIAGRKIREIVIPGAQLQVGFNRVYWDGRDGDGDELANGYYLYQLSVKGAGQVETAIEKLAKVR